MKFGWLTLALSPSPDEDAVRIDQQIEQVCAAEALGFNDVWLTEHYFTGESVYNDALAVRLGADHAHDPDSHRVRRDSNAVPSSGPPRGATRAARQSKQGPDRCRHRQRHGLQRIRIRRPWSAQR